MRLCNISIHAPAKGATDIDLLLRDKKTGISIHAPAKGATVCKGLNPFHLCLFQSTLPRRERLRAAAEQRKAQKYFNPRSREGSDCAAHKFKYNNNAISIHAPAKGATVEHRLHLAAFLYFNPRSREGSD